MERVFAGVRPLVSALGTGRGAGSRSPAESRLHFWRRPGPDPLLSLPPLRGRERSGSDEASTQEEIRASASLHGREGPSRPVRADAPTITTVPHASGPTISASAASTRPRKK